MASGDRDKCDIAMESNGNILWSNAVWIETPHENEESNPFSSKIAFLKEGQQ